MKRSSISRFCQALLIASLASAATAQAALTQDAIVNAALVNGDSSQLTDSKLVALRLQAKVLEVNSQRSALLTGLYNGLSAAYDPGARSKWVPPSGADTSLPFIVGDKGHVLASLSTEAGGRVVAYGGNVLLQLTSSNAAHLPLFKRAVQWAVSGNATASVPATFKVSVVGVNRTSSLDGLRAAGFNPVDAACDALASASCASSSQLLVLGNNVPFSTTLSATVRARLQAGLPILYVFTSKTSSSSSASDSDSAQHMLWGMGLEQGPSSGNSWEEDKVASARPWAQSVELAARYGLEPALVKQIVDGSWRTNYDWSQCVYDGTLVCANTPELSLLSTRASAIKNSIDTYTHNGQNLFQAPGANALRLWSLWADTARKEIRYPMDKLTAPARFQQAFVADAIVSYVREAGSAQSDLGSYATQRQTAMAVSAAQESLTVTLPQASGFTAIGRMAVPGKRLSVVVENTGSASVALAINTQRLKSTRLLEMDSYDRPRFLKSPTINLQAGKAVALVSPYGGLLQLHYSGATPGQNVTVKITGAASQPFLDVSSGKDNSQSIANFIQALHMDNADWLEMRIDTVEVHAKASKVRETINNANYGGNVQRYIDEFNQLFIGGAYSLAGFARTGHPLSPAITQECQARGWDCTGQALHKVPSVQHVNVDAYAQCGHACSGNPFDLTAGPDPRAWTPTHELGHGLQVNRLKVYGYRSLETSQHIYSLRTAWEVFRRFSQSERDNVKYRSAYDLIVAGRLEADPVKGVFKRIWEPSELYDMNGERMAFYNQWVHYWSDHKANTDQLWDVWTLMSLHQRLVDQAEWSANKDRLGYSTYAARPGDSDVALSIDGNDNLLIGLSWLTKRDQRPTFALWGITTSAAAQAQVQAYGFAAQPAFFYANKTSHDYRAVKRLDMSKGSPAWPFP